MPQDRRKAAQGNKQERDDGDNRLSVFLRLGPREALNTPDDTTSNTHHKQQQQGRRDRRRGGSKGDRSDKRSIEGADPQQRAPLFTTNPAPRNETRPQALQQRTLTDTERERNPKASRPAVTAKGARADPTDVADLKAIKAKLAQLEQEKIEAQGLADALMHSQQALLQEKAKVQQEKSALERDHAMLLERLEYLQLANTGSDEYVDDDGYYGELPITPDSGMMRALREIALDGGNEDTSQIGEVGAADGVAIRLELE